MIWYYPLAMVVLLLLAGAAAYLKVTFGGGDSSPAGTRPLDPGGGFATPAQLRDHLSADALRRVAGEVRPSLDVPAPVKRKGFFRGRVRS